MRKTTGYIIRFKPPMEEYFLRDYMTEDITSDPEDAFLYDNSPEYLKIAKEDAKKFGGTVEKISIETKVTFLKRC